MQSLYKPLSEEGVMKARYNILADGEYDGVVISSNRTKSTSGNIMADMIIKIFDKDGTSHDIRDFLVFTDKMLWKIKHFCDSASLESIYQLGTFTPETANQQHVRVIVGIKCGDLIPAEKLGNRPVGSCYPDKNIIVDYICNAPSSSKNNISEFNDAIPF